MPRPRTSYRDIRVKALKKAIARSRIDLGLKNDIEASQYMGEPTSSYSRHMKDPLKSYGFEKAIECSERYRFTANEILDIFGMKL